MQNYHDLISRVIKTGVTQFNKRTAMNCKVIVGEQLFYDLAEGFPAITTKKLAFNNMKGELFGFFRGYTNAADFRSLGCTVWDQNANETQGWLDNPYRKGTDDLGPIYGKQWTSWTDRRIAETSEERDRLLGLGYRIRMMSEYSPNVPHYEWLMERQINQLENALTKLLTDPSDRRIIVSGWNVGELDMMALPPCFTPGTPVATPSGYKDIDSIKEGDVVLSGTGIPRTVHQVWKTPYQGETILIFPRYQKHPIRCTPNHPFLVKGRGWVEAKDITTDDFVAIPRVAGKDFHRFEYRIPHNTSKNGFLTKEHTLTLDDYFFLGYFLGDGWCSPKNNLINVAIAHKDIPEILPKLRRTLKISKKPRSGKNVSTYNTRSSKWIELVREFGHGAINKKIPHWVITSCTEAKQAFLDGYMAADGSRGKFNEICATTVSSDLVYGLQLLLASLGKAACVTHQERPATCVIEGRTVSQRGTYFLQASSKRHNYGTQVDSDYIWVGVKRLEREQYEGFVFNLDVEEEHTYMVNNIATHNCHMDYRFVALNDDTIPEGYRLHVVMTIRSWDLGLGAPFNIASTSLFLAIMARLAGMRPGTVTIQATNAHIYENHIDPLLEQLQREHRETPRLVIDDSMKAVTLDTVKGAFERIHPDQVRLEGYDPHGIIKMDMAA